MQSKYKENEFCICVNCNTRIPHLRGVPCRDNRCPNCGKIMFKEGSYHHQLYLKKVTGQKIRIIRWHLSSAMISYWLSLPAFLKIL